MKRRLKNSASRCPGRLPYSLTRREMLKSTSSGFGMLALSALLAEWAGGHTVSGSRFHFAPRAKNVLFFFTPGGVSHIDTFDPKPELARRHGELCDRANNKSPGAGQRTWKESP